MEDNTAPRSTTLQSGDDTPWWDHVSALFDRSLAVKRAVKENHTGEVVAMAHTCATCLEAGRKILLCGNGGSAGDAQHLAAELLVRLRPDVNRRALPAISLAMDSSALTACGNDYGYDLYFERMVEALGRRGDVLVGISTSGNSPNVVRALKTARRLGIHTLGLLGGEGGACLPECDTALVVPSRETGRIQESHITAGHAVMELVEEMLQAQGNLG